jgi:hypothetical protein
MREFSPFVPTDAALKILLNAETRKDACSPEPPGFPWSWLILNVRKRQQIAKRKFLHPASF